MFASGIHRRAASRVGLSAVVVGAVLALGGCGDFIGGSGPRINGFLDPAEQTVGNPGPRGAPYLRYSIVNIDPVMLASLEEDPPLSRFSEAAQIRPAADIQLGLGDTLGITIFESQAGGLFAPTDTNRSGTSVQLPQQQVGRDGTINVPFAGTIRAAGLTIAELEKSIAGRLRQRALDPQIVVTMVERRSAVVSVVGEVDQSIRFSLDQGGERVLGAIARAGGIRFQPHEILVTLQRRGVAEAAIMSEIVADPRLNIQLAPDDTIIVSRQQRYFLALGAVGQTASLTQINRRFNFEDRRQNLADALARAGGIQDDRANPAAVFLFRFERRAVLQKMGIKVDSLEGEAPTIYRADLLNPSMMFLAQRFPMHHNDIIYVSNAPSTDLAKILALLLPFTGSAAAVGTLAR